VKLNSQKGFTIIELMIATAVFSVILLVCTIGLLQIGRMYYKGVTSARAQETARTAINDISQNIQFNGGVVSHDTVNSLLCIGNKRYSYALNRQVTDNAVMVGSQARHALVADDITGCSSPQPLNGDVTGRELINIRMRLARLTVNLVPFTTDLYNVTVRVVNGDDDLVTDVDGDGFVECRNVREGSQFCATSELSTTVHKRVN
jgi:prepilin-type N-terminal cleavage/methylation domain-containing protein